MTAILTPNTGFGGVHHPFGNIQRHNHHHLSGSGSGASIASSSFSSTNAHPFRDRTQELHSIFDLLRKNSTVNPNNMSSINNMVNNNQIAAENPSAPAAKRTIQQQSEELRHFNDAASRFSVDLSTLAETVANLTRLTQGAGVGSDAFEENSQEITRLTQVVRSRLGQLHDDLNGLADLKEASDSASSSSSYSSSSSTSAMSKHNGAVVAALRSKLVGTGNNFRQVMQRRTQVMKDASTRRSKLLADRPSSSSSPNSMMMNFNQQDESDKNNNNNNGQSSNTALMQQNRSINYLRDRQQAVHEIEVAVREVGEIVQDFTRLVYEQDDTIIRIDNDVEDAVDNVNAGSGELMKYLASLSSQRGFILKVLGVLFVFLLFFGFFVVR